MSLLLLVSGIFSIQFSKGLIEFSISPKNLNPEKEILLLLGQKSISKNELHSEFIVACLWQLMYSV